MRCALCVRSQKSERQKSDPYVRVSEALIGFLDVGAAPHLLPDACLPLSINGLVRIVRTND